MARIHHIVTITQGGILYKDIAEIARWIDFLHCYENYCQIYNGSSAAFCIGRSSFERATLAYIEFYTEPMTRLEFEDPQELSELLQELQKIGIWLIVNLD